MAQYDICLSFAGEDRSYVEEVASVLRDRGVRVFYDKHEQASLWGKDLYSHLDYVYRSAARFCVIFVSSHYAAKVWSNHERISAQARALTESSEYILPARFDSTDIPGLRPSIGYVDLTQLAPRELAQLICDKLSVAHPRTESSYRWVEPITVATSKTAVHVALFQGFPVSASLAAWESLLRRGVGALRERQKINA